MNRWWMMGLGILVGILIVFLSAFLYLDYGRPPVSVSDSPFPFEKKIVSGALHARIDREMGDSPLQPTPENLAAGASIYKTDCAFCHGMPGLPSKYGKSMYPSAPQLWASHRSGVVGVSDDPVGETFWRVRNGIRLTGMPAYQKLLSEDQMWQVSLLLSSAAKPLPEAAQSALSAK
jgi:mono/diheme cytochrome c family protein